MSVRYSRPAMAFHWLHAFLVFALLWLGWNMVDLPKGAERSAVYALHKSLGLLTILLVLLRLGWRYRQAPPPLPGDPAAWENRLALAVHRLLLALLVVAPLCGFLAICFTSYPLSLFGLPLPKPGWPDQTLNAFFHRLHVIAVWTLTATVGLHLLGVVRHILRRDGTLRRMLP
jgi:cytochrome b561